jgi:hypothetical protein
MVDRHFTEKIFFERVMTQTFGQKTFARHYVWLTQPMTMKFGQETFGQLTFGQLTFGQETFDQLTFG